jgi:mannose-6-phosphate isomerase-like protein (cupin superfamily)
MDIKNIYSELQKAPLDKQAGIKLIKLTGDSEISVFAAEISPHRALNAHFHEVGIETYQILSGKGLMKVGSLKNNEVIWHNKINVQTGDCYSINANEVHQIANESDETLLAIFSCPESHLGIDRIFVNN